MSGKEERELKQLQGFLAVSRGEAPGDVLLSGGRVVDVFTGEVRRADVLIKDKIIAGVGEGYTQAKEIININGQFVAPGFIESHIHIESSLLPVHEFVRLCLVRGTTAVICDPHEIANVLGVKGIKFILKASAGMPMDLFVMVPSCVPATDMETSGARLGVGDITKALKWERVLGLAEMMNYPGVVFGEEEALRKVTTAKKAGKIVDGHSPGLSGALLCAYVGMGIGSDHECVGASEAREKLAAGMRLFIREGSAAHNLSALLRVVNDLNLRRCCLVTDDKHPEGLLYQGHLDAVLRKAIAGGLSPVAAIQMVTLNPAEYFRLPNRGAVAVGYNADLVVIGDLARMDVRMVFKNGKLVVRDSRVLVRLPAPKSAFVRNTVRIPKLSLKDFAIKAEGDLCNVIRVVPNQIITEKHIQEPTVKDGYVVADTQRDLLKVVVIERHKGSGRMGKGLVAGFGLKKGALGTTVAHDSHNIIIVGTNDRDMLICTRALARMGGGYVAVADGKVRASLPLPIAGLMSDRPAEKVVESLRELLNKAHIWGSRLANPFITLSFLALPVIPELKLTDQGLVDVNRFEFIELFCPK